MCVSSVIAGEAKTVRILTIGNSFSRNATNYLDELAAAGGHTLIHQPLVIGGASFQVHADKAKKHEANPADKAGIYAPAVAPAAGEATAKGKPVDKPGRGLKEHLTAEKWDYVTIQQASIKSHDLATYQPHAGWLRDYITQHAPQAKLLVHQTWAYRKDDPRFTKPSGKAGEPKTQEEMYRGLTEAYDKIAAELGGKIIPVGDAMYAADTDAKWGYQVDASFDPKTAQQPALPNQAHSLHKGWQWAKAKGSEKIVLGMDGHHANLAGEYLGACVWYEVLFGESAVGNAYVPKGLDADYARFLQETAHRAVVARQAQAAGKP